MPLLKSQPVIDTLLPPALAAAQALPNPPHLAAIVVGENPNSLTYIKRKQNFATKIGCHMSIHPLAEGTTNTEITQKITTLSKDETINGLILQLPLPQKQNPNAFLNLISPAKDVDGLSQTQRSWLHEKNPNALLPATPLGVLRWLKFMNISLANKHVCVIGRSHLVGAPLATLCAQHGATVTTFSQEHPIQPEILKTADIICAAAGVPHLVQPNWVKDSATVIDIGLTTANGKLLGDCHPDIAHKATLTAVPGGVGKLTVLSLFTNLIDATYRQHHQPNPTY